MEQYPRSPVDNEGYESSEDGARSAEEEDQFSGSEDGGAQGTSSGIDDQLDDFMKRLDNFGDEKPSKEFWNGVWETHKFLEHGQSEINGKTILHLLVEKYMGLKDRDQSKLVKSNVIGPAINQITRRYPNLIGVLDYEKKQTPLFEAIIARKPALVSAMVKTCGSKELARAIEQKCLFDGKYENTLHRALNRRSESVFPAGKGMEVLRKICSKATREAILATDGNDFTPLHHAVHYERSSEDQLELIDMLLRKGDSRDLVDLKDRRGVLDKYAKVSDRSGEKRMSVFEYHKWTRDEYERTRRSQTNDTKGTEPPSEKRKDKKDSEKPLQIVIPNEEKKSGVKTPAISNQTQPRTGKEERPATSYPAQDRTHKETKPSGKKPQPRIPGNAAAEEAARQEPQRSAGKQDRDKRPSAPGDGMTSAAGGESGAANLPNTGLVRRNTGAQEPKPPREPDETEDEKGRKREAASIKILNKLKIQFLRTRSYREATAFLYGKNPDDIQIYFDYLGQPEVADAKTFIKSFKEVKFDRVLKYVAFPSVKVERWSERPWGSNVRGRCDMVFFFNWLRYDKKVERILKVIVNDSNPQLRPHADEAIEMCLRGFNVESLEWSKQDLDPVTICEIGQSLRSLSLVWGGQNAVLRGWSDPEGLRALPKLSVVHLTGTDSLEGSERAEANRRAFETRMKKTDTQVIPSPPKDASEIKVNTSASSLAPPSRATRFEDGSRPGEADDDRKSDIARSASPRPGEVALTLRSITVTRPDQDGRPKSHVGSSSLDQQASVSTQDSHRWLESADQFGQRIESIWNQLTGDRTESQPLIVALIDDGVDNTCASLQGRILTGRTFAYDEDSERERIGPWYVSEKGHGTVMADSICRVCPMAMIYPIRLNTDFRGQIDAESAALAIEAAVDRKADIISMSWTVDPPEGRVKAMFSKALDRAISNNVIMFCSAKDAGHSNQESKHWPTDHRRDYVIKVGAAQPSGLPYDWAGPLDNLDFILPGVEVVATHRSNTPPGAIKLLSDRPKTGSSVATALGAGLAATVLYCFHIAAVVDPSVNEEKLKKVHQIDQMRKAIAAFGSGSKDTERKFVEISTKLDKTLLLLNKVMSKQAARSLIADLARDLMPAL